MKRTERFLLLIALLLCTSIPLPLNAQQSLGGEKPVDVHLIPFSHLDFFWGGTREECLARGNEIIAQAILLARSDPEFTFLIEDENFLANYVETHPGTPELAGLQKFVKQGRFEIAPKWAAIFQNIPNGEVHVRNFQIGKRYARTTFGVDPKVAHLGDLPGYVGQFPQIAAKSGTPFAVMTRMGPKDHSMFRWTSPDGSKILVWNTLNHYSWGSELGLHRDYAAINRAKLQQELTAEASIWRGPVFMNWGSDLWAPNEELVENVRTWNSQSSPVRFRFSTPSTFFDAVSSRPDVPDIAGEIPSSWPNVMSSLPHLWSLASPATNTLLTAEKFATVNYALGFAPYPREEFALLWKKLIESMDHNHDGQGGTIGDDRKMQYSQMAISRGGEILRDSLRNIAERVKFTIPNSHAIVVFNPMGWQRDDVVTAHVTLYGPVSPGGIDNYRHGMQLVDEKGTPVPFDLDQYSENISRALELTFVARDVPSLGYRTYYLVAAEPPQKLALGASVTMDDDKDRKEPRRPMDADVMENDFYRVSVDRPTGRVAVFDKELGREVLRDAEIVAVEERGGNYIGIEPLSGRSIPTSIDQVRLVRNNAVRSTLEIRGRIADIPIEQRVSLFRGLKRVEFENTIEWQGPRYIRIQQLFPYTQTKARVFYGVPFGVQAADDLMPGTGPHVSDEIKRESWLRARQVQDWIFAGDAQSGITVASPHQLYKLDDGLIRAEMLRGARFASIKVVRGEEVTSVSYPPRGRYQFRFSLSSSAGDWKQAHAYRLGMNSSSPLVAVPVVDQISGKSLPSTNSFFAVDAANVVLSSLKKADAGSSIVARFYETVGQPVQAPIDFLSKRQRVIRTANLLEEDSSEPPQDLLSVSAYEIRTVLMSKPAEVRK